MSVTDVPPKNPRLMCGDVLSTYGLILILAASLALWMVHLLALALMSRCNTPIQDAETQTFLWTKDDPREPALPSAPVYGSMPLPIRPNPTAPPLAVCLIPSILLLVLNYFLDRSARPTLEVADDMVASESEMDTVLAILDEMRTLTLLTPSPMATPKITPEITPASTPTTITTTSDALAELHARWGRINAARAEFISTSERSMAAKRALVRKEAHDNTVNEEILRKAIAVIDTTLAVLEDGRTWNTGA
ncbi:hypothetical protein CcaverHIS002_0606950 [Cutaneotrichosporon cavernicola]|uniref:Uncharacterized protein n=1 Tax=Cutaneotrichosporon cavernicola TaxID=279322 RepID=A0AA48L8Z5_9TREE|nr:uncharacterized protein CcaverHIS019_0606370 [Cutaneotrichosporon cavernicola]BEI86408.1 hypothetical protein CcaverHIS002_0606950 [Cutaneotrichosporon cavernicola]BEI94178.1 hypothetical protein CcaverHIS019_0606370 [Cutaneotrichosporon cavernicola]BEJ01958.1 hypothetical protein CcaverHIS631_0606400 [Cutaneotrichosporon cavernicola]